MAPAGPTTGVFRAQARESLDVAAEVDNLLPLMSLWIWIVIAGIGVAILGGLAYAVGSLQVTEVTAHGRVVAPPGLAHVTSPAQGVVRELLVANQSQVGAGQPVAVIVDTTGRRHVATAPAAGSVWQELTPVGQRVELGGVIATMLPTGSDEVALVPVPEEASYRLKAGMPATITTGDGERIAATVTDVADAPIPGSLAADDVSLPLSPDEPIVKVTVAADSQLEPGEAVDVAMQVARETLLQRLVSQS